MEEQTFDLKRLCELAGPEISGRTVHYYIQQGLLPHAGTAGPGAKYDRRHLVRLQLIKRLQREYLPLAEIRERMRTLTDAEVAQALAESTPAPGPGMVEPGATEPGTALDYVRQVLAKGTDSRRVQPDLAVRLRQAQGTVRPPVGWDRSQWDRIALTPDFELHVRRPLTREGNRRLERLLEAAQRILKEDA